MSGLAAAAGARYSRYADDLAFSGDRGFERGLPRFIPAAAAIALDEGFRVRFRKLRVMRAARQQRLAGLVLNVRPNVPRRAYDALRATLHNAARLGAVTQNRDGHEDFRAHLLGRIAWVAHSQPRARRSPARAVRTHRLAGPRNERQRLSSSPPDRRYLPWNVGLRFCRYALVASR